MGLRGVGAEMGCDGISGRKGVVYRPRGRAAERRGGRERGGDIPEDHLGDQFMTLCGGAEMYSIAGRRRSLFAGPFASA